MVYSLKKTNIFLTIPRNQKPGRSRVFAIYLGSPEFAPLSGKAPAMSSLEQHLSSNHYNGRPVSLLYILSGSASENTRGYVAELFNQSNNGAVNPREFITNASQSSYVSKLIGWILDYQNELMIGIQPNVGDISLDSLDKRVKLTTLPDEFFRKLTESMGEPTPVLQ